MSKDGKLIDYGVLIHKDAQFDKAYPKEAALLRDVHQRRNQLPGSHPYEKRGGGKNRFLKKNEQRSFVTKLCSVYNRIVEVVK